MEKIAVSLTVCLATSLLLSIGCSKSKKVSWSASSGGNQVTSNGSASSATNGPTDLTIRWNDGKKYALEMSLDQDMQMNTGTQPFQQHLKITQGLHMTPLKALDDGGHQVEMEFDSQKFDLAQNGHDIITFDSTQHTS